MLEGILEVQEGYQRCSGTIDVGGVIVEQVCIGW